jgi:hypothetical protein
MSPEGKKRSPLKCGWVVGGAIALVIYFFPKLDKKRDGFL